MRLQFSIRTALVAIALLAPFCIYVADYLRRRQHPDFVLPTPTEYAAMVREWKTRQHVRGIATVPAKKMPSAHAQDLVDRFPPLGIEYWESKSENVEPGMHEWALYRYVPPANRGISFLRPHKGTQVFVYAVDSELAAMCEVTVEGGSGPDSLVRVVKFHGFAEHNLACSEWGSLDAKEIVFDDQDKGTVLFAEH